MQTSVPTKRVRLIRELTFFSLLVAFFSGGVLCFLIDTRQFASLIPSAFPYALLVSIACFILFWRLPYPWSLGKMVLTMFSAAGLAFVITSIICVIWMSLTHTSSQIENNPFPLTLKDTIQIGLLFLLAQMIISLLPLFLLVLLTRDTVVRDVKQAARLDREAQR